jgi:signal transduction histidine kinase/ActR/RegA family two-component response regulator
MTRFALVGGAVALPFIAFAATTPIRDYYATRASAALERSAADMAESLNQEVVQVRAGLWNLANSAPVRQGDETQAADAIRPVAVQLHLQIGLLQANRPTVMVSPSSDAVLQLPVARSLWPDLQTAVARNAPVITDLQPNIVDGAAAIAIIVPVANAPDTALVALVPLVPMLRAAGSAGTVIVDPDGNALVGPDGNLRPSGDRAAAAIQTALRQDVAQDGVLRTVLDDGPVVMAAGHRSFAGFETTAVMPANRFDAAAGQSRTTTYGVGMATLLISLTAIWWMLQRWSALSPELAREVARLRGLMGAVEHAAVMVRDAGGRIHFWSRGCVRMFGWSDTEAVGHDAAALLRTEPPRNLVGRAEMWTGDVVHHRKDGERVVAAVCQVQRPRLNGAANGAANGLANGPNLVVESFVDVTALRDAEEKLRTVNADLEQRAQRDVAAREIASQRAAAQADRIQALGQLAGGIAHDFNNILQAIAGSAALITLHPDNRELVSRFSTIIGDSAARGAAITRRVLLLARRGDLKAEPIDPNALLSGVKGAFVYTLGPSITVELVVAEDLPCLMADKKQLEIALVNLATNARDAMPDGGVLRLNADIDEVAPGTQHAAGLPGGCYVQLSLTDTGVGMSDAVLSRVGEPFFTTKGVGNGTGLGLSMVKGFAEQSGGGFAIESTLGVGTTARIWLPIAAGRAVSLRGASSFADGIAQILLVDDDPHVRDIVGEQLEQLGHSVLSAAGGRDALLILRARAAAIDLMITDLSMPGMNGLALIQRARDMRPCLPAILLTGADVAAMSDGEDQQPEYTLVPKPASKETLQARITELLGRDDGVI